MGIEIERKFKVVGNSWRGSSPPSIIRQGFIFVSDEKVVRVRVEDGFAHIAVKGRLSTRSRLEFEYGIPTVDADEMLDKLCEGSLIEKRRYRLDVSGALWEIDQFIGANKGLVIAEIELKTQDQEIDLPAWVGEEVTDDPRYLNSNLFKRPYSTW